MSLFKTTELTVKVHDEGAFTEAAGDVEFMNAGSLKLFKQKLSGIEQNKHYHFSTGGQWSMHELISYLLTITGSADIYKSTWAISEDPVRAFMDLKNKKVIRSIHCIFDYKTKEQKSPAYLLAKENFDTITLAHCHAKATVLINEQWGISVSGSANDTRNPRIERGVICTHRDVAEFDIAWMKEVMHGNNPFKVRLK